MKPIFIADSTFDIPNDKRLDVVSYAGRHIPKARIQVSVIVNSEHESIAAAPILVLTLRQRMSALLIEDTERRSVIERYQIIGKLTKLLVQDPCMIDGPAFLIYTVQEDVLVSVVDHVLRSFEDVPNIGGSDRHLAAHVSMSNIYEMFNCSNCSVICSFAAFIKSARIMQLFVSINRDGKRSMHLILIKKLLHFRFEVQESIRCNTKHEARSEPMVQLKRSRHKILSRFPNKSDFKEWLATDKVNYNAVGVVRIDIRVVAFKQPVDELFCSIEGHCMTRLMSLIAVRTGHVAVLCNLQRNILAMSSADVHRV